MANRPKRPTPAVRMVQLLSYEKQRHLRKGLPLNDATFDAAWDECWDVMVKERAWPHFTHERRGWREAQDTTKPMLRRAWKGETTSFDVFVDHVRGQTDHSRAAGGEMSGTIAG